MGVYGDIAVRAWSLAVHEGISPSAAWQQAVGERYPDPAQKRNALKHTCPKGAFLGLCGRGLIRDIEPGHYTRSVRSSGFALAALEQLRANPMLVDDRSLFNQLVFGARTPNDEIDVVLSLWEQDLFR
jgi:hypothetical protein